MWSGAGIAQSAVCWARCPDAVSWVRSYYELPVRVFFSLGVNMGSDSIPTKLYRMRVKNRGLVSLDMHSIARNQKILTFMSRR